MLDVGKENEEIRSRKVEERRREEERSVLKSGLASMAWKGSDV